MGANAHLYRFMDKVRIQDNGCWLWLGAKSRGGGKKFWYGSFRYEGRAIRAHVFSANIIKKLECPKGFERHHTCENTLCVCPEHLEVITQLENNHHRWEDGEYRKNNDPPF